MFYEKPVEHSNRTSKWILISIMEVLYLCERYKEIRKENKVGDINLNISLQFSHQLLIYRTRIIVELINISGDWYVLFWVHAPINMQIKLDVRHERYEWKNISMESCWHDQFPNCMWFAFYKVAISSNIDVWRISATSGLWMSTLGVRITWRGAVAL